MNGSKKYNCKKIETSSLIKRYDLNNKVKLFMNYLREKNSTSKYGKIELNKKSLFLSLIFKIKFNNKQVVKKQLTIIFNLNYLMVLILNRIP